MRCHFVTSSIMTFNSDTSWLLRLLNQQTESELKTEIITFHRSVVRSCRDEFALQEARDLVPISNLVQENLKVLEGDYQDNLLPILTEWFSNEFFTWFKPPVCEKCHSELTGNRTCINPEGLRVEAFNCSNYDSCNYTYDFIRHNDPAILLHTRRGRCGEWANCFFLILRAMDYDARIVLDTTDHVWNEVWSESRQQWIHVDPCEAVVDCPLLYELGWSKKLEHCIAFSKYEIIDVTRRYTKDINAIRRTRSAHSSLQGELEIAKYLDELTVQALQDTDDKTREVVLKRRAVDKKQLEDFEAKGRPDVDVSRVCGRKTGSIAWRVARGEYSPILKNHEVIKVRPSPSPLEPGDSLFELQYNCDKNIYISPSEELNVRGWQKLIYTAENIDHKFERDWRTSYLARYESCPPDVEGKIQWRFDISSIEHWTRIEIMIVTRQWPDTRFSAKLSTAKGDENFTRQLELDKLNVLTSDELRAAKVIANLDLIISIGGGQPEDNTAWQKPQLFRQERGQGSENPFSLRIFS